MSEGKQTDAELVSATKLGDKRAFGELIERHQAMALRTALFKTGNESVAEDLVQEALLQAYLSLKNLRNENHFKSWFRGIVLNVCRSFLRAKKFRPQSLDAILDEIESASSEFCSVEPGPDEIILDRESSAQLLTHIDSLSTENRLVTLLYYYGQLSVQEIAQHQNMTISAVKNRLYKSRQRLREQLTQVSQEQIKRESEQTDEPTIERTNNMIKVSDVHIIRTEATENYIVFLLEQTKQRAVPIWVGGSEGVQIRMQLTGATPHRPKTYHFVANILQTLDATLEEVRIESLTGATFYAIAKLKGQNGVHELDVRPSDAITLALYTGRPIFIADDVMGQAGKALPETFDPTAWQSKEAERVANLEEMYGLVQEWEQEWEEQAKEGMNRFTIHARQAFDLAKSEAKRLRHNYLGTEHLLLGLAQDTEGVAAKALQESGVSAKEVTEAVEKTIAQGLEDESVEPTVAPRVKHVIALAAEERRVMGHRYIGTEHLLLGLMQEGKGAGVQVLISLNLNLNRVRSRILEVFGG
ncbi:bifunctional nuclease family protein [Chloroflexi bacterium TSY]|nr:bifunctional nuclease family protein [Chloroflexi bacterium TSY]